MPTGDECGYPGIDWCMNKQTKYVLKRSACAIAAFAFVANAWAVNPFTVSDIRVEGLQRVEPGTVFASLPFRVGESYSDDKGTSAIRALFALGLFKDVRIDVQGNVLVVIVEERPTIAEVSFTGTKEFDKEALVKSLREVGLNEGRPFDKALADKAEQELKRQYIGRSLYGAEIVTTVTPIERNRVNLNFSVIEGDVAKIKDIRIVGSKVFSESSLLGLFELDSGGWLSWYTKSDRYVRSKLNADLETLRSHYLNRGYLEFKIDSTQVAISPDKQDITLTINITEGEQYVVSDVKLEGNFLNRDGEFKTLVAVRPGEPYNAEQVALTSKAFSDYFGTFGYAFAQVQAKPDIDRTNNRVSLVFVADPARRAYVRKINIAGNVRTRDEIIRREFRQFEASWYDGDKIKLSRDRVDRLGYFKEVNVETVDVPGAPDQIDVLVTVAEKPTGNLQLGAAFSSGEKFSVQFKIAQENFFGTGNYLGIDLNTSKFNRQLSINTLNPYFTNDGVSRAFDLYYRSTKPLDDQGGDYQLITTGASVRFGIPFTEQDTVYFGGGVENTKIKPGTNIPAAYLAYANRFGYTSSNIPLTIGWASDTRDNSLAPNSGLYQRLNGEWGAAGDARYLRGSYQNQYYIPLNKKFTIALNGELGWGKGIGARDFPVFKNFYAGGLGSVRGFGQGSLGTRDVTGSYIGGVKKIIANIELLAPFPGAGNDRSLRLFAFADTGNVFSEFEKYDLSTLRTSAGAGLSWVSPIGPLRLVYARPVRKFPGDKIQSVQFQIGTSF